MRFLANSLALLSLLAARDDPAARPPVSTLPTPGTPAQNAAALQRVFARGGATTVTMPAGTYELPCGTSLRAAGSLSLIGAGMGRTVLRLERACLLDGPVMAWISKSGVRLSGFTIDLNNSRSVSRQDILRFHAYEGDARGLQVDHVAILRGNTLSIQIAVAAAGGFTYSGVVLDSNRLEMTPGRSQNQCIGLTTVNNQGRIPGARITNNICRGSGIQTDGEGTLVAGNDVSGYQFGTGIFTAFVTKTDSPSVDGPSSRGCIVRDNVIHDTGQTLDVNRTATGGIENNCVDALVENNRATNLGGPGFVNFANGTRYIGNSATAVGYMGTGSSLGDADGAAFVAFESSTGFPWYRSSGLIFERNTARPHGGRPRYGYSEEPYHLFNSTLAGNSFEGSERALVVQSPNCRTAPVRC